MFLTIPARLAASAAILAMAGCGVATQTSTTSGGPAAPAEHSGTCTVLEKGTNASISFTGTPDSAALKACQQVIDATSGNYYYGAVVKDSIPLCQDTVTNSGDEITIIVEDGGGLVVGNGLCANLAHYGTPIHS